MAFPSTISSFTNPLPTDKLNSPSHSSIETAQNNELVQIENVLGTDAAVLGTILGDLRSSSSGGGGHIQSANKGGTGQTNYVKGDMLVATSSSVIAKQAVTSVTGYVLLADPTTSTGITWGVGSSRIFTGTTSITTASTTRTSLFTATIPGGLLGTANAFQGRAYLGVVNGTAGVSNMTLEMEYGGNNITIQPQAINNNDTNVKEGYMNFLVVANGAVNSQKMSLDYSAYNITSYNLTTGVYTAQRGISSVASGSDANLIIFATMSNGDGANSYLRFHSGVIEKI